MAGNGVLTEFLEQLLARTPLVVLAYKGQGAGPSCANDEHSHILDAIAGGDADRAVAVMKEHLQNLEDQLNLRGTRESAPNFAEIFGVQPH